MRGHVFQLAVAAAIVLPAAAHAEGEEPTPAVAVSYNVGIYSDYRFRGISYTNRQPAVQGGIDLAFRSGFYLGTWTSNITPTGGSHQEVDLYGGYGGTFAGLTYSAGALGYVYPGGHGVDYVELQSTLGKAIGPVSATLTVAYTPNQGNTVENLYTSLGADVAIGSTPFTASFSFGRENGAYDEKLDWLAGISYKLDKLKISASYVDSNYKGVLEAGHNGRAGAILAAKLSF